MAPKCTELPVAILKILLCQPRRRLANIPIERCGGIKKKPSSRAVIAIVELVILIPRELFIESSDDSRTFGTVGAVRHVIHEDRRARVMLLRIPYGEARAMHLGNGLSKPRAPDCTDETASSVTLSALEPIEKPPRVIGRRH